MRVREALEYAAANTLLKVFGWMPRRIAYRAAELVAWTGFLFARRQRATGMQNLKMALPDLEEHERRQILRRCFSNLGRQLVEFSHFPALNKTNIADTVVYEGLEHYVAAAKKGKGVLFLTGHFGAWELSAFAHSVYGYPLHIVVRSIDNPKVDQLVERYRTLSGNRPLAKKNAMRDILKALRSGETVGILIDQNTTREEGIFVDFFGVPAATTPVTATLALRTRAPVVPGLLIWDATLRKHRLRFDPPIPLIETGDPARDVVENTRAFHAVLEKYIRQYPDQWLWIHRRWKTRPEGEPGLY
jgi:KDO2-lipid IV(A) lauroyltransferase